MIIQQYKNEDLFKAFNAVKNHLKKGGLFLLDCFNPNIQFIVEGEKDGENSEWNEMGELLNQALYKNGKIDGDYYSWYGEGRLREHFQFVNGLKQGLQQWWNENGSLQRKANFVDDKIDGELIQWFDDGEVNLVQHFSKGTPILKEQSRP